MKPRVIFTESASKHGISEQDAIWAVHYHYASELTEDQRHPGKLATRYIGPARPPSTRRLEVVMYTDMETRTLVIFHVMEMRAKFQHLIDEQWGKK